MPPFKRYNFIKLIKKIELQQGPPVVLKICQIGSFFIYWNHQDEKVDQLVWESQVFHSRVQYTFHVPYMAVQRPSLHMCMALWQHICRAHRRLIRHSGGTLYIQGTQWVGTKAPVCPVAVQFFLFLLRYKKLEKILQFEQRHRKILNQFASISLIEF